MNEWVEEVEEWGDKTRDQRRLVAPRPQTSLISAFELTATYSLLPSPCDFSLLPSTTGSPQGDYKISVKAQSNGGQELLCFDLEISLDTK